jgi:Tol biopolymer transport system component
MLIVIVLALVAGILFWLQLPHLLEVTPLNGAENIPAGESLRLTFSSGMETESVESRLEVEPPQTGKGAWRGNTYIFTPDQPWQNNTTYNIRLAKGAQSNGWLHLAISQEKSWSFTIEAPLLAYLYPADGPAQIYTINPLTGEQNQMTHPPGEVLDFTVSQNGAFIFYSLNMGTQDSAIYALERVSGKSTMLLDCPQALCRAIHVSQQNGLIAYERTPLIESGQNGINQVWMTTLPTEFSLTANAFQSLTPKLAANRDHQTDQPLWSSTGLLAYYDDSMKEYVVQTPQGESVAHFPSQTGQPGEWSPSGKSFIFPEFISVPQTGATLSKLNPIPASHLLQYSLDKETPTDLTKLDNLEDNAPEFSPDGQYLIFARKYLDTVHWTPGRQIYILPLNSSEAFAITNEPQYNHYNFTWKPDGKQIAYVRFNQTIMTEPPEIWLTNPDGSGQLLLVRNGFAPQWLP